MSSNRPWIVVVNPGTDQEKVTADFKTYAEAIFYADRCGEADVMRLLSDGTLTTDF